MKKIFNIKDSVREAINKGINSSDLFHESMEIPPVEETMNMQVMGPTFFWTWEKRDVA